MARYKYISETVIIVIIFYFLVPSVIKIPRVKSYRENNKKNYSIGGQRSEFGGKLSCKMTALNRCTVTDSLWNRYADCRSSWNFEEILRPSS